MNQPDLNTLGTRDRILLVASDLFYRQGYHATGINQIIREAQVAKASFYDHFGSKEALAVAYLERRRERWIHLLLDAADGQQEPVEKVLALFDFLEQWVSETDFRGCAFLNIAGEFPTTNNHIRQVVSAHKQAQRELIVQLVRDTALRADERTIRAKADSVYLLFEAALAESRVFHHLWPIHAARKQVRALLT